MVLEEGLGSFGLSNMLVSVRELTSIPGGKVPLYSSEHVAIPEPLWSVEETALAPESDLRENISLPQV